jgi:S1-C subfamily serine protease
VVLILTKEGSGSGSLLTTDGVILTNWHIVRGKTEAGVIFKPLTKQVSLCLRTWSVRVCYVLTR